MSAFQSVPSSLKKQKRHQRDTTIGLSDTSNDLRDERDDGHDTSDAKTAIGANKDALNDTENKDDDHSPLGSLDNMLQKARKRNLVTLPYKFQIFWDGPVLHIKKPPFLSFVLTRGDLCLILVSSAIHANGFALGLLIGKVTARPILQDWLCPPVSIQLIVMPLWPVLWAIVLDQLV